MGWLSNQVARSVQPEVARIVVARTKTALGANCYTKPQLMFRVLLGGSPLRRRRPQPAVSVQKLVSNSDGSLTLSIESEREVGVALLGEFW